MQWREQARNNEILREINMTCDHFFGNNYCVRCGQKHWIQCSYGHLTLWWSKFCGSCGRQIPNESECETEEKALKQDSTPQAKAQASER